MRTNKFIPILLALAIHFLPLAYFLLKRPVNVGTTGYSSGSSKFSEGIDLNGFSLAKRPNKKFSKSVGLTPVSSSASGQSTGTGNGSGETDSTTNGNIVFLKFHEPLYPPIAREKGYEGIVKIKVDYNQAGNVDKVEIIQSSGHIMLDEAVKKTASDWKLSVSNAGYFEKSFEFKLNN